MSNTVFCIYDLFPFCSPTARDLCLHLLAFLFFWAHHVFFLLHPSLCNNLGVVIGHGGLDLLVHLGPRRRMNKSQGTLLFRLRTNERLCTQRPAFLNLVDAHGCMMMATSSPFALRKEKRKQSTH